MIEEIIKLSCYYCDIKREEFDSPNRDKEILFARYFVAYYLRNNYNTTNKVLSLKRIGKLINRDHATVLNAIRQMQYAIDYNYCGYGWLYDKFAKRVNEMYKGESTVVDEKGEVISVNLTNHIRKVA